MTRVNAEMLGSIRERIQALDGPTSVSTQRAVEVCLDSIQAARERGCTLLQICELLRQEGLAIPIATLKSCLARARRRRGDAGATAMRALRSQAAIVHEPIVPTPTLAARGRAAASSPEESPAESGRFTPYSDSKDL
jgi:hypothetical protein